MGRILKKEDLNKFLYKLKSKNELIAPVKNEGAVRFETLDFLSQMTLSELPDFSPKKYLLPAVEDMFYFPESKLNLMQYLRRQKDKIIFGIRLCDINAIYILDKKLLGKDHIYTQKREKLTIIGLQCENEIKDNCFCTSMNLKHYGDLFFYDIGDSYYIEVGSEKGLKLVSRLKEYYYDADKINTRKRLDKKDLEKHYDDEIWENDSKDCTYCGACTSVCPTCQCFALTDEIDLDLTKGTRKRTLTSCQYNTFWEDSNNKKIINKKTDKFKHRIYHKIVYFKKKYGIDMCTGCGRCITMCPQKIDFVKTINKIK